MASMSDKELNASLTNLKISKGESSFVNSNSSLDVAQQINEGNNVDTTCEGKDTEEQLQDVTVAKPNESVFTDKSALDNKDGKHSVAHEENNIAKKDINCLENSNSMPGANLGFSPSECKDIEKEDMDNLEEYDQDDCDEDVLTGSYGEISLDRELINYDKNSDSISSRDEEQLFLEEVKVSNSGAREKKRPDSLVLTQNVVSSLEEFSKIPENTQVHRSQQTSDGRTTSADISPSFSSDEYAVHSSGRVRTGSDTSGLSELQGTLTIDGDLVTFVAEDLQEKIKMSSPVSRWTESSFPGSRSSTPSLYRQALQPNLHIVDPSILIDLETHAKKVATCVDTMLENLSGTLQSISSLTVDCMETYESSVCKTCDAVDLNIKAVYQLMAKCEELSNAMNPLYRMSGDIKHIKKMLEQLEHIVEHKS